MSGYGASSTCRQAAGSSAILGPGRGFDGLDSVSRLGCDRVAIQ